MKHFKHLGVVLALCIASLCLAQTSPAAPNVSSTSYRIFGIVVDLLSNQPIAGVRVIIVSVTERGAPRIVKSGADGRFLFENLPRGKYSLGADHRGYPEQGYDQHEGFATAIAVGPDLDSEHIIFRLRPGCMLRGTVTNDENEPVQGASVRLFKASIENGRSSTHVVGFKMTDDRGYYSFPHLTEGNYYVAASGQPWYATNPSYVEQARVQGTDPETVARLEAEGSQVNLVYPMTFYPGTESSEEAASIHIGPGESATADLLLHAVRPLRIHISGPPPVIETATVEPPDARGGITFYSGRSRRVLQMPQVRATQMVFGEPMDVSAGLGGTGIPGEFEVLGITPGRYSITVTNTGEAGTTATTQELDITGDMELSPTGGNASSNVAGVLSSNSTPQTELIIRLSAKDRRRSYATRIVDGKFKFDGPVPPGAYEVVVGGPSNDAYIKTFSATGAKVSGRTIQIVAGQPVQLSITMGQGMTRIDGIATKDGKPFAGAMILLVPVDFENNSLLTRRDQSDSDGTFTLGPIVPGKYKVVAIQNGWTTSWADPKTIQPYLKNIAEVEVTGAATTMNVKVQVQSLLK
jgi:hypothetical protein